MAAGEPRPNPRRDLHGAWCDPGRPAPRFCPATAAAAPIIPTDVHVMSENSSV